MTEREALKLALEALEAVYKIVDVACVVKPDGEIYLQPVILECRKALVQPERLAELGWQEIDCPICGGGARAFPKPEQEPVAVVDESDYEYFAEILPDRNVKVGQLLYASPPQRKPLTDEEIVLIVADCASSHQHTDIHFARAIEAAHGIKEKNT